MAKKRKKLVTWLTYDYLQDTTFESSFPESVVVPNGNLTLRQIVDRFTSGLPVSGVHTVDYEYDEDPKGYPDIDSVDFDNIKSTDVRGYDYSDYTYEMSILSGRLAKSRLEATEARKKKIEEDKEKERLAIIADYESKRTAEQAAAK